MKNAIFIIVMCTIIYVLLELKKEKITKKGLRYLLFPIAVLLFLIIYPIVLNKLTLLIGIESTEETLLIGCVVILLILVYKAHIDLINYNKKINDLTVEVSLLKKKLNKEKD